MSSRIGDKMNQEGILIIISGFSGAGKGTIVKELIKKHPYALSISATTREPRNYEQEGREYFFVSKHAFNDMINQNQMIEWAEYCGNYYGTPRPYVEEKLAKGEDVILEIEMKGALKVKEQYPNALLIFISPPSIEELKNRLIGRGTEDLKTINHRLYIACIEADVIKDYDYIVINDSLEESVNDIHDIIMAEHKRTFRNLSLIERLKGELIKMTKGDV